MAIDVGGLHAHFPTLPATIIPSIPSAPWKPNSADCKLHNDYDPQFCVLAAICLALGGVMCFFGYRLFKFIMFLGGFLLGFFFTYLLCAAYMSDKLTGDAGQYKNQVFLGISVGIGIIAGLMTLCLYYVGLFVLGAAFGWFVGMAFLPLISEHSEYLSENNWLPYVVLCGFALAGGILILCMQKAIIIVSTSFIGAFLAVNSFDYFLENSKVLYYTVTLLHGTFDKSALPHCWYTWVLFALIPVMFVAGLLVQSCKTSQGRDHREAYDRRVVVIHRDTPLENVTERHPIVTESSYYS